MAFGNWPIGPMTFTVSWEGPGAASYPGLFVSGPAPAARHSVSEELLRPAPEPDLWPPGRRPEHRSDC